MLQNGDIIYITNNIKLACALLTIGHQLKNDESSCIEENGKKEVNFVFNDSDGSVGKDAQKWKDGIDKMEKEEPMAYLWAYAHNRDRILDTIKKATPMVRVKYGNKMILYPKNASEEDKRKIMKKL
jgi:hypothetical protein